MLKYFVYEHPEPLIRQTPTGRYRLMTDCVHLLDKGLLGMSRQCHDKHRQLKKFSKEQLSSSPGREAGVWTEQEESRSPVSNEVNNRMN